MEGKRPALSIVAGAAAVAVAAGCAAESAPEPSQKAAAKEAAAGEALSAPFRIARLSGRIRGSLALYEAGAAEMASDQLSRIASRPSDDAQKDLRAAGLEAVMLTSVARSLDPHGFDPDGGSRLAEISALVADAADQAGGDPAELLVFLMDTLSEAYAAGVIDGFVVDGAMYHDAYGYALAARARAERLDDPFRGKAMSAIDALIALWAEGPVPVSDPARAEEVAKQANAVRSVTETR